MEKGYYKHFKGGIFRVIGTVTHTETEEELVLYYHIDNPEKIWARPVSMWNDVINGKKRFEPVKCPDLDAGHGTEQINGLTGLQRD